jgi:zinc D-Ala-D-Ala carboxypeptidase
VTQLTAHFSVEELEATSHADFDNVAPPAVLPNLADSARHMEGVRDVLGGKPIHVNSGYRSPALNRAVGGVADSAHLTGHAVDFICPAFGPPIAICRALVLAGVRFDQLIEEGTWVHISFDPRWRGQVMTKTPGGGYRDGLPD